MEEGTYSNILLLCNKGSCEMLQDIQDIQDIIENYNEDIKIVVTDSNNKAVKFLKESNPILFFAECDDDNFRSRLQIAKYVRKELKNNSISIYFYIPYLSKQYREEFFETIKKEDLYSYTEAYKVNKEQLSYSILSNILNYKRMLEWNNNIKILKKMVNDIVNLKTYTSIDDFLTVSFNELYKMLYNIGCYMDMVIFTKENIIYSTYENSLFLKSKIKKIIKNSDGEFLKWDIKTLIIHFNDISVFVYATFKKPLSTDLRGILSLYFQELNIHLKNIMLRKESEDSLMNSIALLSELIENRSKETSEHVKRVMNYTEAISRFLGLNDKIVYIYKMASMTHDIGKIGIPDKILNKPDRLTEEEFEIMKRHTIIGYNVLKHFKKPFFRVAANIALTHHENYDGTGYPYGIKGENIPLEGRIVALADYYDALNSDRIYRRAWEEKRIVNSIKELRGIKFDPKIVDVFFKNYDKIIQIKMNFLHKGMLESS